MAEERDERTDEQSDITSTLKRLATVDKRMLITWPGQIEIHVNVQDARAAQLLLDLMDKGPITVGEAENILLAAIWWIHFYGSAVIVAEDDATTPPPAEG